MASCNTPMTSSSSSSFEVSSSSISSESSTSSSPCSSSPSPLPQLAPTSQCVSKFSVPFLWEEKPGITKPSEETQYGRHIGHLSSSASLKASTYSRNLILYGKLPLEYPSSPLPPPPRLSQAFLSQPRSREKKLLPTRSLLRRRPHEASWKKPSKEEEEEEQDPFFLAMKACTEVEKNSSGGDLRPEIRGGFDGLQAALRGLFKSTKKGQKSVESLSKECTKGECRRVSEEECSKGGCRRRIYEESDDHREKSSNGEEDEGRGTSRAHGSLHALFSVNEREISREERSGSNLHTHMLERDKEITNQRSNQSMPRKAHFYQRNAPGKPSSINYGSFGHVGVADQKAIKPGDPLASKSSRNDDLISADIHGDQGIEPKQKNKVNVESSNQRHNAKVEELINSINQGHIIRKPSMHNAKVDGELRSTASLINQGHAAKPNKLNAKVVEFNSCGGYIKDSDHAEHQYHHSSKHNIFSDLLGCRALPSLNGASIHPSLKPFSFHHI